MMDGKRKPMFARKPSVVVAIEDKMAGKPAMDGVVCPKCGMQLADSPENREYAKMRAEEPDASDEYEEET